MESKIENGGSVCTPCIVVRNGIFEEDFKKQKNSSRGLDKLFSVPAFEHHYPIQLPHPLSSQYSTETHNWLASHGVDNQLGPELWKNFVKSCCPDLVGHIYNTLDSRDYPWIYKFMGWLFAIDDLFDESACASNADLSCETILNVMLVLLWNDPGNKLYLEHMQPIYNSFTTEKSEQLVRAFIADLLHAENNTKSLVDIKMVPLATTFRELWTEYCEVVPAQFVDRWGLSIQDYLVGYTQEATIRKKGITCNDINEYVVLRTKTGCQKPWIVCMDMAIARKVDEISHIPNSLFYASHTQNLVAALSDVICWHNDIFSFYKDVILHGSPLNFVAVLCAQYNFASYTEAGVVAMKILQDRVTEMELNYQKLITEAPTEFHPALEIYMDTCRKWISGSHEWHVMNCSKRYKNTSEVCV